MLSRIWTHPWCLQLDYISKENKVNEQWHTSGKLQGLSSFISTQTNPGGEGTGERGRSFLAVVTFLRTASHAERDDLLVVQFM